MPYLFFIIILLAYGLINYLIGKLCWNHIFKFVPFLNDKVFWVVFWFMAWSYLLLRLLSNYLPDSMITLLSWISGYWLALFFYVTLILLFVFSIKFLNSYFNFLPNYLTPQTVTIGVTMFIVLLLLYGTWNSRSIEIRHYNVAINKEVEGLSNLNIIMLGDVHLDHINDNKRLETIVEIINEQQPDLVLLVGDIIDTHISFFQRQQMGSTFRKLQTTYGTYGVLGNHEYYTGDIDEIITTFEDANIKMLRDDYLIIADSFYLIGRDDLTLQRMTGNPRQELKSLMHDMDKALPIILMDHQPFHLDESQENGVDLQLSGHTHRGQLFPNHLITQRMYEVDWGYLQKENLHVIVTSGVNTWGPPIRIGSKPEIKRINVTFE